MTWPVDGARGGVEGKGDKNCGLTEFSYFGNGLDVTDKSGAGVGVFTSGKEREESGTRRVNECCGDVSPTIPLKQANYVGSVLI